MFVIPSQIAKDLVELAQTNRKGVEYLWEAEGELAEAESELDRCEAQEFLNATGSVAERQATAKLNVIPRIYNYSNFVEDTVRLLSQIIRKM